MVTGPPSWTGLVQKRKKNDFLFTFLQPCPDDSEDQAELIIQRASETCEHVKTNGLYEVMGRDSSNYLNTGIKYSNNGKTLPAFLCI